MAADCPTPPPNHIPAAPTSELNIDSIKSLLLEYHQNYYDLDVAVVFETVQNYLQRNAGLSKRPAVVLDIGRALNSAQVLSRRAHTLGY